MNTKLIADEFLRARDTPSDINEHMARLFELAGECDHIVEAGVRYVVSTWAFILGCACDGGEVHSYCWNLIPEIQRAIDLCKTAEVPWTFHEGDWLKTAIPETDLLFIDTNHFFWQLEEEFRLHAGKARKYIVLHDTTSFGDVSQDGTRPGLWQAVENLCAARVWKVLERRINNSGLTILVRR